MGYLPIIGDIVTYKGNDPHEKAGYCLIVGKGYEVIDVVFGIDSILSGGGAPFAVIKDESDDGHWAITSENVDYFELN